MSWNPGPKTAEAVLLQAVTGPFEDGEVEVEVESFDESIAGVPGRTYSARAGRKRIAMSTWYCPAEDVEVTLMAFIDVDEASLLAFQRRMLATARCVAFPAGVAQAWPVFDPPEGWVRDADLSTFYWENATHALTFTLVPHNDPDFFDEDPLVRKNLIDVMGAVMEVTLALEGEPIRVAGSAGRPRLVWHTTFATPEGETAQALWTMLVCPGVDGSYLGLHIGDTTTSLEAPAGVLASVHCPPAP